MLMVLEPGADSTMTESSSRSEGFQRKERYRHVYTVYIISYIYIIYIHIYIYQIYGVCDMN